MIWLAVPALSALGLLVFGPSTRAVLFVLYSAFFVLLAKIDLEQRIVPNRLVLPAVIVAPITSLLWGNPPLSIALGCFIHFLWYAISFAVMRGRGIGLGDVKLALVLGLVTGFPAVFASLVAGAFFSGAVSAGLLLARRVRRRDYIPFAPFMLAGALTALLWQR
jgi:leader peptidase (prepilin peptidase)/N-methyltransferase